MILVIVLITGFSAVVCGEVARRRGLRVPRWIALALVFGPLAIPFVLLVRDNSGTGGGQSASS